MSADVAIDCLLIDLLVGEPKFSMKISVES